MIHFDISNLEKELKELEKETTSQEFWENQQNTSKVLKRITEIKNKIEEYKVTKNNLDKVLTMILGSIK